MKTYENKKELLENVLDVDAHDIPDVIAKDFDEADDPNMAFAKMACNIATYLVENAGGEAQFDVDAVASDDMLDDIIDRFENMLADICELVIGHGEITGIEVLGEEE